MFKHLAAQWLALVGIALGSGGAVFSLARGATPPSFLPPPNVWVQEG